jgi:hypothetical protein
MPRLTAMDEQFVHQIPEPLPNTVVHHQFWRESLFFVMHPTDGPGDVVILTLAHFPARGEMDSLQLGRVGGVPTLGIHRRPYDGDPHTMAVGTVKIDIVEPFRTVHLHVGDGPNVPLTMDITFTARTAANGYRRGTMRAGHELIWDQSHMIQSGWYNGTFAHQGTTYTVENWWGQRDHSWGIRDHARCPLWIWLAVQLPEGMLAVWHWEYPNGARTPTVASRRKAVAIPFPSSTSATAVCWIVGRRPFRTDVRRRCRRAGWPRSSSSRGGHDRPRRQGAGPSAMTFSNRAPIHSGGLHEIRAFIGWFSGHGDLRGDRPVPPPLLPGSTASGCRRRTLKRESGRRIRRCAFIVSWVRLTGCLSPSPMVGSGLPMSCSSGCAWRGQAGDRRQDHRAAG